MLLKIIALAISILGLSEAENIIHTKAGSTEKVVILCPNGKITIERRLSPLMTTNEVWTNSVITGFATNTWITNFHPVPMPTYPPPGTIQILPGVWTNYIPTPNAIGRGLSNGIVPGTSITLPYYPDTTTNLDHTGDVLINSESPMRPTLR